MIFCLRNGLLISLSLALDVDVQEQSDALHFKMTSSEEFSTMLPLRDFFRSKYTKKETHSWVLVTHDSKKNPVEALAEALSDRIMEERCSGCQQHYTAWKELVEDGVRPSASSMAALKAFIRPVFGLPGDPNSVPKDHLEGYIAEQLWYFLTLETSIDEMVVRIERPGFTATDPGGDGLVVHRLPPGDLLFRLWELKKCTGTSSVSSTVQTAYKQLGSKATEYLARYTTIGQEIGNDELAAFYGRLIEFWIDASPEASAGVSVSTSRDKIPKRCFTTFGKRFPRFINPVRLRGMLTAIDDFPAFAEKVKEYVWTGL